MIITKMGVKLLFNKIKKILHINKTPIDISKDEQITKFHFDESYNDLVKLLQDNKNYLRNHKDELKFFINDLNSAKDIYDILIMMKGNLSNDKRKICYITIKEKNLKIKNSSTIMFENTKKQLEKINPINDVIINRIKELLKQEENIFNEIYKRCKIFEEVLKNESTNMDALINTIFIIIKQTKILDTYLEEFEKKIEKINSELEETIDMFNQVKKAI